MVGEPLRDWFLPALAAKLLAGLALGWLYTHHSPTGGDTVAFFHDACQLAELARQSPGAYARVLFLSQFPTAHFPDTLLYAAEPRSFLFIKLLSLANLLTGSNYWLSGVYFSLFSCWGAWHLANVLAAHFPTQRTAAAWAFLGVPSVVFWSAGVIKESLAVGSLGLVTAMWLPVLLGKATGRWQMVLKMLASGLLLVLLWKLKYYYFAVYVPCLAAGGLTLLTSRGLGVQRPEVILLLWFSYAGMLVGVASQVHPNLRPEAFLAVLTENHDVLYTRSAPGRRIEFYDLQATLPRVLVNLPLALISGLFRPLPGEGGTGLALLAGLENAVLLVLTLLALGRLARRHITPPSTEELVLLVTTGVYISTLAALLALSTPNFGTLSRYKVAFLPFLTYLLLVASRRASWGRRAP